MGVKVKSTLKREVPVYKGGRARTRFRFGHVRAVNASRFRDRSTRTIWWLLRGWGLYLSVFCAIHAKSEKEGGNSRVVDGRTSCRHSCPSSLLAARETRPLPFPQEKNKEAIQSFAEDIYYCSLEYGPRDVRTTLGYYNIAKIFESQVSPSRPVFSRPYRSQGRCKLTRGIDTFAKVG
jgi:hypothetical protein